MADVATLKAQLEALERDIASGSLTVKHGETLRTARPMKEMLEARALLMGQIADLEGKPRRRVRYAYQSGKGL